MNEDFANDIPAQLAQDAHSGTSFCPGKRGAQAKADYAATLQSDFDDLSRLADTDEKRALFAEEFDRYLAGYRRHTVSWLHSRSRLVSTMIAGPANFPVRRQEKYSNWAQNKLNALISFRERALAAIRRKLCPESRPIMAGDENALDRLQAKIAEAENLQSRMKAINMAHAKYLKNPASLDKTDLSDREKEIVKTYQPEYSWEPHPIPPYRLQNNNANIRRMKERLGALTEAKDSPETFAEGNGIRLKDCPAENRVRLFFPGKPSADVRSRLKSSGFRWAPSLGCWQAYRNHNALTVAKEMIGVES